MMVQDIQVQAELYGGGAVMVSYSYNTGTVYGAKGQAAGISGNQYNYGANKIHHCYNIGFISGYGSSSPTTVGSHRIGSIVGEANNSSFNNCWWTSINPGNGYRGNYTESAKVTEDVLKGYVNNLGADYFTEDDIGINDGFPILKWEKEKWEKENT